VGQQQSMSLPREVAVPPPSYSPDNMTSPSYTPDSSLNGYLDVGLDHRGLDLNRLSTLSAKQRRHSEVSTVARDIEYLTESRTESSVINTDRSRSLGQNDAPPVPPRASAAGRNSVIGATAGLGRIVSALDLRTEQISVPRRSSDLSGVNGIGGSGRIDSTGIKGHGHARTASIGRMVTPLAVEVSSSRGSSSTTPKSRGSLTSSSGGGSNHKNSLSLEESPALGLGPALGPAPGPNVKKFQRRRTKSMATTATASSAGESEVFGLDAVQSDGEFVHSSSGSSSTRIGKGVFLEDPEEEEDSASTLGSVLGMFPISESRTRTTEGSGRS